jgi:hypothetical protein
VKLRLCLFSSAALIGTCSSTLAAGQVIAAGPTYVCNGERLHLESCDIRDLSDNSQCMVAHLDKMRPNGFPTYTYETRGTLKKLLPTCQQPSAQSLAKAQAAQQKNAGEYQAMVNPPKPVAPAQAPQNVAPNSPMNFGGAALSGDSLKEARCVVSGRDATLCGENSLGSWFEGAIANGVNMANAIAPGSADMLSKATKPLPPGLEIAGNYVGNGGWRMQFNDRSAMMACGDLDQEQRFYTIGIVNGLAAIKIGITPKPFLLYLRPDGMLADAGPVVVDGRVVTGSSGGGTSEGHWTTSQSTTTESLTPMEAQQHSGDPNLHYSGGAYYSLDHTTTSTSYQPGTYTPPTIHYRAKTETCTTAILKSAGKTQEDALKGITEAMILGGKSTPSAPAGLRMHGAYVAPTGLSVEFFPESAILECGPAIKAYPYTIQAAGGQAIVRVDAPHPLVMGIKPDNSLDPGSGQYEVQGRRILGKTADGDFEAAPATQTCTLALLKPGAIPTAAPSMSSNPMASANNSGPAIPSARSSAGDAVLSANAFPPQAGAANPLVGRPLFLLKDSFDNVLLKNGMHPPAGKTPIQGWDLVCQQNPAQCQQMMNSLKPYMAAVAQVDASGKATFLGVPAGSYYVFSVTHNNHVALTWDVRVDLKSGTNSLVLDQKNAGTLQ